MVAPHAQFFDIGHGFTCFGSDLAQGAVVVQTQHGGEVARLQVRGRLHSDVSVGVGRVADHQHFDIARCHGVQSLTLGSEDGAVDGEQLRALHAWAAWA